MLTLTKPDFITQTRNKPFIDVRDYYVGTTTHGIQEAMNAHATVGGVIYIAGQSTNINIDTPIAVPDGPDWQIFGDGAAYNAANVASSSPFTSLRATFNGSPLISAASAAENTRLLYIHDMTLLGNAVGTGAATGDGLSVTNYLRLIADRLHLSRFDGSGVVLTNSYGAHLSGIFAVDNGRYGLSIAGASAATTNIRNSSFVTNCRSGGTISGLSNVLVNVTNAFQLGFYNCNVEGPAAHPWNSMVPATLAYCMNIAGAESLDVIGCYFDNAIGGNSGCLFFQGNTDNTRVQGNWFAANTSGFGIQFVKDAPTGSIQFNTFDGTPKAIWTPLDSGGRHQLEVFPNYYYSGSTPVFASALLNGLGNGWWKSSNPSAGTWKLGDKVYDPAPASAGYIGRVCTVAGTPGTWKTFGLIS